MIWHSWLFLHSVILHIIVWKLGSSSHHVTVGLLNRFLLSQEARNIESTFYRLDLCIMSIFMDIFFTSSFSSWAQVSRPPLGSFWTTFSTFQRGITRLQFFHQSTVHLHLTGSGNSPRLHSLDRNSIYFSNIAALRHAFILGLHTSLIIELAWGSR